MRDINIITGEIIASAIEVHRTLGPGLLESSYESCVAYELVNKNLKVERQKPVPVIYKEIKLDCGYRLDLLVEDLVIVEFKAVEKLIDIHEAQILTHMRFSKIHYGLLINFNVKLLKNGIRRFIL